MIIFNLDKLLSSRKMQSVQLAEELGCTVQTISRIKTGKVKSLRMESLDALCAYFGCQPGDLLEYVPDDEAVERFGREFVTEYQAHHGMS